MSVWSLWLRRWALVSCCMLAGAAAAQEPPPEVATPEQTALVRVVLTDGQAIRGRLVSRDASAIVIELVSGGQLVIPNALVSEVEEERAAGSEGGQLWFKDANRTRYFFGPSAMMMKRGEAYFSQKELLLSEFGYGITDYLTAVVGAVPIAWFAGLDGLNAIVGLKAGTPIVDRLHASVGAYALTIPNLGGGGGAPIVAGFGFGTLTYGEPNWHVSLSSGVPFLASSPDGSSIGPLIVTASGSLRVARNIGLVSENWILLNQQIAPDSSFLIADGIAVRFLGERFSVDVGAIWFIAQNGIQLDGIPIPWLDFTYHFDFSRR